MQEAEGNNCTKMQEAEAQKLHENAGSKGMQDKKINKISQYYKNVEIAEAQPGSCLIRKCTLKIPAGKI